MKLFLKIAVFVLTVTLITASLVFSSRRLARVTCGEVEVVIPDHSSRIVDRDEISRLIGNLDDGLLNRPLYALNTEMIERGLTKIPAIKNAEVFRQFSVDHFQVKGKLVVEVEQREPLFRILTGKEDYYMDREGVRIDSRGEFTLHVLVVTGEVDEKFARERLLPMVSFIGDDAFWSAQMKQIHVVEGGEIQMVPLVGDQLVDFGEPEGYQKKLRNLKALYEQGFAETGWGRYDRIVLKYENQVVCTKRNGDGQK